jgi:hypothetical protein
MTKDDLTWAKTTVISLLLAGNAFFIKRLVDRVDENTEISWQLRQDVVILKTTFEEHKKYCPKYIRGE